MLNYFKIINPERGVSLIITFFIMLIILAVVLFVSIILYSEIKIIRNIGDAMVSFFAADSGIEKVLYYDRKVVPVLIGSDPEVNVARGLCTMYASEGVNSKTCDTGESGSVFCTPNDGFAEPQVYPVGSTNNHGCDLDKCNNCKVSFTTYFDDSNKYYYSTSAEVYPSGDGKSSNFQIQSLGAFGGAERQIEIIISLPKAGEAITIKETCVNPKSTEEGTSLNIAAQVVALSGTVGNVWAIVHDAPSGGTFYGLDGMEVASDSAERFLPLSPDLNIDPGNPNCTSLADCDWSLDWSTSNVGVYYVDIKAIDASCVEGDTSCTPNVKTCHSVSEYGICGEPEYCE